jgi:hypothetical protein
MAGAFGKNSTTTLIANTPKQVSQLDPMSNLNGVVDSSQSPVTGD